MRRQTKATADCCRRNGGTLDTSPTRSNEGKPALRGNHRENPCVNGLAAFPSAVESGRLPAGAVQNLENLDRLTRESVVPAVNLFTGVLSAGIKVVRVQRGSPGGAPPSGPCQGINALLRLRAAEVCGLAVPEAGVLADRDSSKDYAERLARRPH